jgi:zinc protease
LYLATEDENFISKYWDLINEATDLDLINALIQYFRPSIQNRGYLLEIEENEIKFLNNIQEASDREDQEILETKVRTTQVEPPKWSKNIPIPKPISFSYPKPTISNLPNGLCLMLHHNPLIPKIAIEIEFKANYLYEDKEVSGLSLLHSQLMLEGTKKISSKEFHQLLESRGIQLSTYSGLISIELLSTDLSLVLDVLHELFTDPLFDNQSLEKIRSQMIIDLKEYWDTPIKFVNQIAKDLIYKSHPYSKQVMGTIESLKKITLDDVWHYHQKFITPQETNISIVGDLSDYDKGKNIPELVRKYLGDWQGPLLEDLDLGEISYSEPKIIEYEINRDQVVLAFAGPSIARTDELYDQLSILDVILTGGPNGSMNSRLFSLREQTGLFYTVSGSLVYNAQKSPGMVFIKTIVSPSKVEIAKNEIQNLLQNLIYKGINEEEFSMAKNVLSSATVEYFETNSDTAKSFLFLKKFNFPFDLFDKRGAKLSIIDLGSIHQAAQQFCNPEILSIIKVGRQIN